MADTPPQPPGSPFNQSPNAEPPPPGAPTYEPPAHQPPPGAPQYQTPPQPAPPGQPPASYPAAPNQSPYEPPVPGVPPAPYAQPGYAQQYGGPGQPPPPPGWGAPVAPVKKSRRSLWVTLAVIFGALLLVGGACTVWFIGTVSAPVDASNEFLAAIDRGDYAGAIALSDPGCSQGMSEADLTSTFQGADIEYNLNSSSITNSNAAVSGSFSVVGENVSRIEVFLENRNGWSVCGFDAN